MKLITAVVNRKDSSEVCSILTKKGISFTKMSTIGGFLKAGNVTLLIGTDDHRVEEILSLIRQNCSRRKEVVPYVVGPESPEPNAGAAEVVVGGATVFVTNVERFEKM